MSRDFYFSLIAHWRWLKLYYNVILMIESFCATNVLFLHHPIQVLFHFPRVSNAHESFSCLQLVNGLPPPPHADNVIYWDCLVSNLDCPGRHCLGSERCTMAVTLEWSTSLSSPVSSTINKEMMKILG